MILTTSGHPALINGSPGLTAALVPGTTFRVTAATWALPVLLDFERRWQSHAALGRNRLNLNVGLSGSYNYRQAMAASSVSDHAGYAVDNRYDVLKPDNERHMTDAEQAAVQYLLADYAGALGWGGPKSATNPYGYQRLVDEMHVFVAPGQTSATFAALRSRLGIRPDGTRVVPKVTRVTRFPYTGVYAAKSAKSERVGSKLFGTTISYVATERDALGRVWLKTPAGNWIVAAATAYKG